MCEDVKFSIVGTIIHLYENKEEDIVVATFDKRKDAEKYIKKSRLKKPKYEIWGYYKVFKKKSLLSLCKYGEVRKRFPEDPIPHNPTI